MTTPKDRLLDAPIEKAEQPSGTATSDKFTNADREARLRFAAEQSRLDRQHAVEYVKAVLQLLIGTSGVATTASLALIGALKDPSLMHRMILPIALYFGAMLCGMMSAHFLFLSKQAFAHRWEGEVFDYPKSGKLGREYNANRGVNMQKMGIIWIRLGFAAFGLATAVAVWALTPEARMEILLLAAKLIGALAALASAILWFWAASIRVPENQDTFIEALQRAGRINAFAAMATGVVAACGLIAFLLERP
jgi:hypothetical protein